MMISYHSVRQVRGCLSKRRFKSKADAVKAMKDRMKKRKVRKAGIVLRVYLCDRCAGWHLTSKPLTEGDHEKRI
jgi:hypothetical protein